MCLLHSLVRHHLICRACWKEGVIDVRSAMRHIVLCCASSRAGAYLEEAEVQHRNGPVYGGLWLHSCNRWTRP